MMKPTTNVLLKDGVTRQDFPEYKTRENWLHWDMNLFKTLQDLSIEFDDGGDSRLGKDHLSDSYFIRERNGCEGGERKMKGLVAITDATERDGGFLTIHGLVTDWNSGASFT